MWVAEPGNTTTVQSMVKVIAGPTPQQAKLVNHIYLLILYTEVRASTSAKTHDMWVAEPRSATTRQSMLKVIVWTTQTKANLVKHTTSMVL